MSDRVKTGIVIVAGLMSISSASILIRLALSESVTPLIISAFRLTFAFILFTIPAVLKQSWKEYATLTVRSTLLLITSGVFLALHFATWITSLSQTSILSSVVLVASAPVWIGIASPLVLNESPPLMSWIGILVAIVGGAILGLHDLASASMDVGVGDLLALAGAVCAAGYLVIGRLLRHTLTLTTYVWTVYGVASVCLTAAALVVNDALGGLSSQAYVWLIALSLIPQLIGHTSANYLVRKLPATQVSVYMLGESVGSSILAIVVFKEFPQILQAVGGLTILVGIGMSSIAWQPQSGDNIPELST